MKTSFQYKETTIISIFLMKLYPWVNISWYNIHHNHHHHHHLSQKSWWWMEFPKLFICQSQIIKRFGNKEPTIIWIYYNQTATVFGEHFIIKYPAPLRKKYEMSAPGGEYFIMKYSPPPI